MKRLVWILFLLPILYIGFVLIQGTIFDFKPESESITRLYKRAYNSIISDTSLSFVIWNIAYAGLGEESDFFYEKNALYSGSMMVRPSKEIVEKNWKGIKETINNFDSDFILLQEVDIASKRSYYIDHMTQLSEEFGDYYSSFAVNYKVARVPVPVLEFWKVYGKVESGLGTIARYTSHDDQRLQLPGNYSWPTRIFMLDRCAARYRYRLDNGKTLVVYNIHNSAYDDGTLKQAQMSFLKEAFMAEYNKGHYVIAGGDWNQCPPNFKFDTFMPGKGEGYEQENIDSDMMPDDWQWIYDPATPTNRKVSEVFKKGETFVTLIDFYLVSPNIKVRKVEGVNLDFKYSDHQPVRMEIELR